MALSSLLHSTFAVVLKFFLNFFSAFALDAIAFAEAFAEAPGKFYDKEVAARLVKYLFSPRNALDPAEAYRQFRGRDANIDALMRDRGFPVTGKKTGK